VVAYPFALGMSSILLVWVIDLYARIYFKEHGQLIIDGSNALTLIPVLAVLVVVNLIPALASNEPQLIKHAASVGAGLMAFVAFSVFTNSFSIVPKAVVRTLSLGNLKNVTLTIAKDTCSILKTNYRVYELSKDSDLELQHIKVLSRIGKEYYVDGAYTQAECNKNANSD
jgi:hypothetical protein